MLAAARELVVRIGKEPIVVRNAPGFATSRLGVAIGLEAMRMFEDGVACAADIDKAMELGYRHPMGPLRLTDLVGLDVRLDIARHLEAALGPRFAPAAGARSTSKCCRPASSARNPARVSTSGPHDRSDRAHVRPALTAS